MPARIRFAAILLAALLALPAAASAQNAAGAAQATPSTPASSPSQQQTLRQLQQQAARLTLIAQLPEADRSQASQLLSRADALRQRSRALRIQELQSYVDALKAGTAPNVARAQAQQQVADQRVTLAKDMASLRSDVQAFLQKVPQARALLRGLAGRAGGGQGAFGGRPGMRNGRPGLNGAPGAAGPGQRGSMMPWWNGQRGPGAGRWYGPWSGNGMGWEPGADMPWSWQQRGWQQRGGPGAPGNQNGMQNGGQNGGQNATPPGGGSGM